MRFNIAKLQPKALLSVLVAFATLLIFLNTFTQTTAQDSANSLSVAWTSNGIPTLVGSNGHTLYTFARDENGTSACEGGCAENWPPFTVEANSSLSVDSEQVVGTLGSIQRSDGSTQVTYNGSPLYYFIQDTQAGDALGHGTRDLWFAANPADIMLSSDGLHLVGAGGMSLYVFTEDSGNDSYCLDECAREWHPLYLQQNSIPHLGAGLTGSLDTFERADGQFQLSYNGWPVYFFHEDEAPGDMNGEGVKDVWFAADINLEQLPVPLSPAPTLAPTTVPPVGATATTDVEETPELTPEVTPEVTPEETAEVTPEVSPEVTPETTPEATSAP